MAKDSNDKSTENLLNDIFKKAVEEHASDIHIEPLVDSVRIRFRIDGVLHERQKLDLYQLESISTRLKVISNLDVTKRAIPQDGHFEARLGSSESSTELGAVLNVRISFFPTINGEAAVLRLLNRMEMLISLNDLGIDASRLATIRKLMVRPYGMVLVTGPAGAGKTTTLYAMLREIQNKEKNIITLEDPVEFSIEGIRQSQVNPDQGFSFAVGIRSILRQDPDAMMVGEIRDSETAEHAVRASLTGRILFSTVHSNTTIGTIARLIDMGVERSLIAYALNGVIAQRLVRKICDNCKIEYSPDPEYLKYFGIDQARGKFFKGKGCAKCRDTGYQGRTGIFEILELDNNLRGMIVDQVHINQLQEYVDKSAIKSLQQDAIEKILAGMTSVEEAAKSI